MNITFWQSNQFRHTGWWPSTYQTSWHTYKESDKTHAHEHTRVHLQQRLLEAKIQKCMWLLYRAGGDMMQTRCVLELLFKRGHFLKKVILLFIKNALNWSKVTFIMLQKILFKINAVLLNFLFIKESWKIKCITVSTKTFSSTTVFNIDNNQKCFLSSKSAY